MPNVSLILAGAVSLGSFEAGVLDELLYVLDRLNADRPDADRYRIDSIAGASAGSMTAALVAQAVMRGFHHRELLHQAWVEEIGIAALLDDVPANALFSKKVIEEIGARCLPADGHGPPSSLAADTLALTFTVTNLNGVNYALARSSAPDVDATFESTFYAERRDFRLRRDRPDDDDWAAIRAAAIASGNFPVAFAPTRLAADPRQWPDHSLPGLPAEFTYVDGGMFNNEPVGEAVRLARGLDDPGRGAAIAADRLFLLVDANLNRASHDLAIDEATGLVDTGTRLATAMMGEATANDWLKALRRNNEVDWRDRLVATLAELVRTLEVTDRDGLRAQLEAAAEDIVARKRALFGDDRYPADYRDQAVGRLTDQFGEHAREMDATRRHIFGNLVFLVNSVSGLDRKRKLNLHMIHAEDGDVAGELLASFGGFLSREWREHDYTMGRQRTRESLPWILGIDPTEMPEPEPDVAYEPARDLGDIELEDAPREAREQLRFAAMLKVQKLTAGLEVGPPWMRWLSGSLLRRVVRWAASSWLGRRLGL
ncbi:MAG: patatin-like phospholipase family protein [Longimicrobiales bacterium]